VATARISGQEHCEPSDDYSMKLGIVGLPNVGKSTLFNALTENQVDAENYPFCTIDPNVGVVAVPDERLELLDRWVNPPKTTPATVEFLDVAGLVRNANEGEGLGNEFLGQIRNVNAVCHVLRVFDDSDVSHVEGIIDPLRDKDIIETEFYLADLEIVENRLNGLETKARLGDADEEYEFFQRIREDLSAGKRPSFTSLSTDQTQWLREISLLSTKPMLYVLNVNERILGNENKVDEYRETIDVLDEEDSRYVTLCAQLEEDLSTMDAEERAMFLDDYGLSEPGLDRLVRQAYRTLDLITYFTYNENELRAWSIERGSTAPEAAGQIHSDFREGFIKAETVNFQEFKEYKSWKDAKEGGAVRSRGDGYEVKDGDILLFQFD